MLLDQYLRWKRIFEILKSVNSVPVTSFAKYCIAVSTEKWMRKGACEILWWKKFWENGITGKWMFCSSLLKGLEQRGEFWRNGSLKGNFHLPNVNVYTGILILKWLF